MFLLSVAHRRELIRRELKQAWKHLSHAFHGKGSGRLNTEKHLKKIAEEKKREAMAAGDSPLVMATAFALRAERIGSATMVLSTGNKRFVLHRFVCSTNESADSILFHSAAPISADPLASSSKPLGLSKKAQAKVVDKGSNGTASTTVFSDIPMRALPLPTSERNGSPTVRAGFAPVQSFSTTNGSSTAQDERAGEKFIIPVSVKRARPMEGSSAARKR